MENKDMEGAIPLLLIGIGIERRLALAVIIRQKNKRQESYQMWLGAHE